MSEHIPNSIAQCNCAACVSSRTPQQSPLDLGSACAHLVVIDKTHLITGVERTMPGNCYCVRCCQQVPYTMNADGKSADRNPWETV